MTDNSTQQGVTTLGGLCAYISVDSAQKVAEFYEKAFGAKTVFGYPPDEQGRTMHIHQHVNGSSLMIGDFYPDHGHVYEKPQAFTLQLVLKAEEIDDWWKRAVDAGCTVEVELQEMFWGDRWGSLRDPFDVRWAMNAPVKAG